MAGVVGEGRDGFGAMQLFLMPLFTKAHCSLWAGGSIFDHALLCEPWQAVLCDGLARGPSRAPGQIGPALCMQ